MKEFDLNKIGKEMPYKLPSEDFFENFSNRLFSEVESQPIRPIGNLVKRRRKLLVRRLSATVAVAASVVVAIFALHNYESNENDNLSFSIKEDIVNSIDSYLTTLSDEELSQLSVEREYQRDFYQNLPNYQ